MPDFVLFGYECVKLLLCVAFHQKARRGYHFDTNKEIFFGKNAEEDRLYLGV